MVDYLAFFDDQHGNSTMGPPPLRFWHGATRGLNPALLQDRQTDGRTDRLAPCRCNTLAAYAVDVIASYDADAWTNSFIRSKSPE